MISPPRNIIHIKSNYLCNFLSQRNPILNCFRLCNKITLFVITTFCLLSMGLQNHLSHYPDCTYSAGNWAHPEEYVELKCGDIRADCIGRITGNRKKKYKIFILLYANIVYTVLYKNLLSCIWISDLGSTRSLLVLSYSRTDTLKPWRGLP